MPDEIGLPFTGMGLTPGAQNVSQSWQRTWRDVQLKKLKEHLEQSLYEQQILKIKEEIARKKQEDKDKKQMQKLEKEMQAEMQKQVAVGKVYPKYAQKSWGKETPVAAPALATPAAPVAAPPVRIWSPEEREKETVALGDLSRRVQEINARMEEVNTAINLPETTEEDRDRMWEELKSLSNEKRLLMEKWREYQGRFAEQQPAIEETGSPEAAYASQQRQAELAGLSEQQKLLKARREVMEETEKITAAQEKIQERVLRPTETREQESERKLTEKLTETEAIGDLKAKRDAQMHIYRKELIELRGKGRPTTGEKQRQSKLIAEAWKLRQAEIIENQKEEHTPILDERKYLQGKRTRLEAEIADTDDAEEKAKLQAEVANIDKQLTANYMKSTELAKKYAKERRKSFDEWQGDFFKEIDTQIQEEEVKPEIATRRKLEERNQRIIDTQRRLETASVASSLAMELVKKFPELESTYGVTGGELTEQLPMIYEAHKTSMLEEDVAFANALETMAEEIEKGAVVPPEYTPIGEREYRLKPEIVRGEVRKEITAEREEEAVKTEAMREELKRRLIFIGARPERIKRAESLSGNMLEEAIEDTEYVVTEMEKRGEEIAKVKEKEAKLTEEDERMARNIGEGADYYIDIMKRLRTGYSYEDRMEWIKSSIPERRKLLQEARNAILRMGGK